MRRILDYWALALLSSLMVLLVTLIFDTSWPVAYVFVVSTPSGATVSDGEGFFWTTPARIPVPHDGLAITVTHPGRIPFDTLLTTELSGETVLLTLPYRFSVVISSDPTGASVLLDGSLLGETPMNVFVDEPGLHYLTLTKDNMITVQDSFSLVVNIPDSLHYLLPREHPNGMIMVPSGNGDSYAAGNYYLISRHEVTNSEFRDYLTALEPVPLPDSTNRWGRTDVLEEIFPGDYPLPFIISSGGWMIQEGQENHPVTGLTFRAAREYCMWLTSMDMWGLEYRLPTEEEWQTAALAGSGGPWPWGSKRPDGHLLNLSDRCESLLRRHPSLDDGFQQTAPVGSYPDNNWGLYDMAGNVWEYCISAGRDSISVAMGGSWLSSMDDCRCDALLYPDTSLGYPFIGFRVAASICADDQSR